MNKELEKQLFEKYSHLFKHREDQTKSLMYFGFSYADGWFDLTKELLLLINWRLKGLEEKGKKIEFEIVQMKEKFGGLRCYFNGHDDGFIDGVVMMAEHMSTTICEFCGNKGKLQSPTGWMFTLCDKCYTKKEEENKVRLEEYEKKYGKKL